MSSISETERQTIVEIAKKHGIVYLALFGSAARDQMSSQSDVDLIAHFSNPHQLGYLQLMGIEQDMTDALGKPIQLLTEEEVHPYIRESVNKDRVVLLDEEAAHVAHG